jgi:alkanesulfonate monooxygenase SsuD/methylene tetrahydromethanopterin reductase-like flavin-dependent oxidoreductase (luciferase family)
MLLMYFTERGYYHVPEDEVIRNGGFFGLPNRFFDPAKAADLYNMYLDEAQYVEEMGYDGIMLNEHHGTPYCMGAVMDVEAAILARITRRVKIVLLGNPLPVVRNPLRLAEELAEIDLISRGRLVAGWVRGAGSEQLFNNANPALNRELFNEAHDVVVKAWTQPGPFRYEGKHFHFRFVNPWVRPLQQPHPPIWIPGLISLESVLWAAGRGYPYIGLGTGLSATLDLWKVYAERAAEHGFSTGPENFGYMQNVFVADSDAKAQEIARAWFFGGGSNYFARPEWTLPPGYNSKDATRRLALQQARSHFLGVAAPADRRPEPSGERKGGSQGSARARLLRGEIDIDEAKRELYSEYPKALESLNIIAGTPKTVLPKLRSVIKSLRPGIVAIKQGPDGPTTHEDRMRNIELFCTEVAPALRELAGELGLTDPFQVKPGSRPLSA